MHTSSCPKCEEQVVLGSDPKISQLVVCQSCKTELIVTWLFPIVVDYQESEKNTSDEQGENP